MEISVSSSIMALAMCFAGVFCLSPLAVYLIWLTNVNKRKQPTVVSGTWDFVSLVAALSGFILFGCILFLTTAHSNFRYWTRGNFEQFREAWIQEKSNWLLFVLIYCTVLLLFIIWNLKRSSRSLSVYAVDTESLLETVNQQVAKIAPQVKRQGLTWPGMVEVKPFHGLAHCTIHMIDSNSNQRQELERSLRNSIPNTTPAETTPASWLSSAALACTVGSVCSLLLVLFYLFMNKLS
jgi:hypothetical protein